MEFSAQQTAQMLMQKGKRAAAAFLNADLSNDGQSHHLDALLEVLLNPEEPINNSETIDWCKWLIAGGRTPSEFSSIGKLDLLYNFYRVY